MKRISGILLLAAVTITAACGRTDTQAPPSEPDGYILATVDTVKLTIDDLRAAMPAGLNEADSTAFARAFIRNWLDSRIMARVAPDDIDMTEIDHMVNEYRNQLILWEYRRKSFDAAGDTVFATDSLRAFFDSHRSEFKLSEPFVKGVYIKIDESSPELPEIRQALRSLSSNNLDRLEKIALNSAMHYDYFEDKWIDWNQIESRIPYDFGPDPDAFLRSHRTLDVTIGGYAYLLKITDVLPAGSVMPFDTARPLIIDRLIGERRRDYDEVLRRRIYDSAVRSGRVKVNVDLGL